MDNKAIIKMSYNENSSLPLFHREPIYFDIRVALLGDCLFLNFATDVQKSLLS